MASCGHVLSDLEQGAPKHEAVLTTKQLGEVIYTPFLMGLGISSCIAITIQISVLRRQRKEASVVPGSKKHTTIT